MKYRLEIEGQPDRIYHSLHAAAMAAADHFGWPFPAITYDFVVMVDGVEKRAWEVYESQSAADAAVDGDPYAPRVIEE